MPFFLSHCAGSFMIFLLTCDTLRDLVRYCSFCHPCGIWFIIPLYLSHCMGSSRYSSLPVTHAVSGIFHFTCTCDTLRDLVRYCSLPVTRAGSVALFHFPCHTARYLAYYSALPVTLRGIWCIIPLYLSHCAGSGMIYPSSDSSHST
jgi:hypothetical protein